MKSNNQTIKQSNNSHAGSALLVVLGMLAFMLFSGLAFSVYMRQSRLPTSFLRRTVATRQLAKAALAEAIEEIDTAIGNDPHPNLHIGAYQANAPTNIWDHRVFVGVGALSQKNGNKQSANAQNSYPALVDPDDTVPTLTLEGLAYLPPNLINEARYYSQRTPTAKWHPFWFDSGRYAYTAIDVSDYFDVNRVYANKPRSSGNRVSLAHLFEDIKVSSEGEERVVDHTGKGSGADKWDDFIEKAQAARDDMPLISLADLNVVWGQQSLDFGGKSLQSPFYNFIKQSGVPYAGGQDESVRFGGLTFVTDSWFPEPPTGKTADGEKIYDLAKTQPFKAEELKGDRLYPLEHATDYGTGDFFTDNGPFSVRMNMLTKAALWDYLDQNKVPLSLAIPTCEQVPMICALEPIVSGLNIKIKQDRKAEVKENPIIVGSVNGVGGKEITFVTQEVKYQLDLSGINAATIAGHFAIAYPFLLKGQKAQTVLDTSATDDGFTVDGRVGLFLTNADGNDLSARPGNIKGLHLDGPSAASQGGIENAVIKIPIKKVDYDDLSLICMDRDDDGSANGKIPVKGEDIMLDMSSVQGVVNLVTVTYRWPKYIKDLSTGEQNTQDLQPGTTDDYGKHMATITPVTDSEFAILKSDGSRDTDYSFLTDVNSTPKKVKVNLALWLRVVNDNEKTVDLVPACMMDDKNLNSVANTGVASLFNDTNPYPLIRLDVGSTFNFSFNAFESTNPLNGSQPLELQKTQLYTGDPRYNHAPEDWQIATGSTFAQADDLAAEWYRREYADAKDKDGDIYMATSDQAEMQSVYELAFLPRLQNGLTQDGLGGLIGNYSTEYNGQIRDANGTLLHRGLMWKTYSPFSRYDNVNDFAELGDGRIVSGDSGMKVNPYSDSTEVLMAAFANTPHDWRVASTNNPAIWKNGEPVLDDVTQFNKEYAWNGYCEKEKGSLCWDCLQELAEDFQEQVHVTGDWKTAFRGLDWSVDRNELLTGSQLKSTDSDLFSVDKKFLYGFWHDCFAARQQLFLIFVRAEPMMMGGGVAGQAPPQLGARAVALVWRDPTKTSPRESDSTLANPHRTRILFYHQFD